MKNIFLNAIISLIAVCASHAQSKSLILNNKVATQTITIVDYEESNGDERLERIETYDKFGNLIEVKDYNSKGELSLFERYTYDETGNKTSEEKFDNKGNLEKRYEYSYKNGLKTSRSTFDKKGKLVKKRVYSYTYHE
jgi:hypothetical protein